MSNTSVQSRSMIKIIPPTASPDNCVSVKSVEWSKTGTAARRELLPRVVYLVGGSVLALVSLVFNLAAFIIKLPVRFIKPSREGFKDLFWHLYKAPICLLDIILTPTLGVILPRAHDWLHIKMNVLILPTPSGTLIKGSMSANSGSSAPSKKSSEPTKDDETSSNITLDLNIHVEDGNPSNKEATAPRPENEENSVVDNKIPPSPPPLDPPRRIDSRDVNQVRNGLTAPLPVERSADLPTEAQRVRDRLREAPKPDETPKTPPKDAVVNVLERGQPGNMIARATSGDRTPPPNPVLDDHPEDPSDQQAWMTADPDELQRVSQRLDFERRERAERRAREAQLLAENRARWAAQNPQPLLDEPQEDMTRAIVMTPEELAQMTQQAEQNMRQRQLELGHHAATVITGRRPAYESVELNPNDSIFASLSSVDDLPSITVHS